MKTSILCAFLVVFGCAQVSAKIFTRCGLAKELLRQGFPRNRLEHWVCLVEKESSRNTAARGPRNSDGTYDWGLFQINDGYWCSPGRAGKDCNVKCEDLLLDDITKASRCAKKVYARQGFDAWNAYMDKCIGNLPDLTPCNL